MNSADPQKRKVYIQTTLFIKTNQTITQVHFEAFMLKDFSIAKWQKMQGTEEKQFKKDQRLWQRLQVKLDLKMKNDE